MIKIITFAWADPSLFEKHNLNIRDNSVIEAADDSAIDIVMVQTKECFKTGLNVMIYRPKPGIIWVVVDDRKFSHR